MQKLPMRSRGFSLIELSIVLGVMSIMATSLVPSMVAQHREKLVERTGSTYYHVSEAALAYAQTKGHWPGYKGVVGDCALDLAGAVTPLDILASSGYLASNTLLNPWQNPDAGEGFFLNVEPIVDDSGMVESCKLQISSDSIPTGAKNILENLLSGASCEVAADNYSCTMEMIDTLVSDISDDDHISTVYRTENYYIRVDGSSGSKKCLDGEVLTGLNYKNGGDDHLVGMWCTPLSHVDYSP